MLGADDLREFWLNIYASPDTGMPIMGVPHEKRRKAREVMRAMVKQERAVPLYRIHVRLK